MGARSVAIGGFMATGKSTVGALLAERLGWAFVDLDHLVEMDAGKTIHAIFDQDGEGEFRRMETAALDRIRASGPQVVALGGGTLHQEFNRPLLSAYRILVLRTTWEEVRGRLEIQDNLRPLTDVAETLYRERAKGYEEMGTILDIEGKAPREIVDSILSVLGDEVP